MGDDYKPCTACGREAKFDVPDAWCNEHWARWWGGDGSEHPFSEKMYREALAVCRRRDAVEAILRVVTFPLRVLRGLWNDITNKGGKR